MLHDDIEWKGVRAYFTDIEHYILPCDNYSDNITSEHEQLSPLASSVIKGIYQKFGHMPKEETHPKMTLQSTTTKPETAERDQSDNSTEGQQTLHVRKGSKYDKDQIPKDLHANERKRPNIFSKHLSGKHYTQTKLTAVTPGNVNGYINYFASQGLKWDVQEVFAGPAQFSCISYERGLIIGFPLDYRYGWNLATPQHQALVTRCDKLFQPRVFFFHPDPACWNGERPQLSKHIAMKMRRCMHDRFQKMDASSSCWQQLTAGSTNAESTSQSYETLKATYRTRPRHSVLRL